MEKFNNFESKKQKEVQEIESYLIENNFNIVTEKPEYFLDKFRFERNINNEILHNYFEENNYVVSRPMSIKLEKATTLFICAGIQKLERVIHEEEEFPDTPIFINQPVLRSQFLGSKAIESHTSFHNLTTIDINLSLERHLEHLQKWIDFLVLSGFLRDDFTFHIGESSPRIGKIKYNNFLTTVFYAGLEIGEAVFISSLPQKTRSSFSVSDIGFGLERLNHNPDKINTVENDCVKTLTLIGMSGVQPSNHEHGYRFRMFSKKIVSECKLNYSRLREVLEDIPIFIESWSRSGVDITLNKGDIMSNIYRECDRNFNREILNFLKDHHNYRNEIDINQNTRDFLLQLEKIGDRPKEFWSGIREGLFISESK